MTEKNIIEYQNIISNGSIDNKQDPGIIVLAPDKQFDYSFWETVSDIGFDIYIFETEHEVEQLLETRTIDTLYIRTDKSSLYQSLVVRFKRINQDASVIFYTDIKEIFTTNYDLLMEEALEDLEIPYYDGFVGSRRSFFDLRAIEDNLIPTHWSRLWKIHGSINWYQEDVAGHKKVYRSSEIKKDASHLIYPSHLKYEESRKMPYLALIDQLNRFIRKKSSLLILSGYSFHDEHLNDTIVNALKANPTAMVLGLMFERYEKTDGEGKLVERYPNAYRLAKRLHNLNIWTFDKAIIGTNPGQWKRSVNDDDDPDLLNFVCQEKKTDGANDIEDLIKLGNFSELTNFLKKIIGKPKEGQDV